MIGGPIIKNKVFYFGDYEGKRRVQGTSSTSQVPTNLERSSGYTDLTDILTQQSGAARTDILGRSIQRGVILDPGTTRFVAAGAVDPVSGLYQHFRKRRLCSRSFQHGVRAGNCVVYDGKLPRPQHASNCSHRSECGQAC